MIKERNLDTIMKQSLHILRELGATLELQKAAYIACCTDEELESEQTEYFLNGETSKVKSFAPDLIERIEEKIKSMICNRHDAMIDLLSRPDYQTHCMSRALYRIQGEFLQDIIKRKQQMWTVRTDIFDSDSEIDYSEC